MCQYRLITYQNSHQVVHPHCFINSSLIDPSLGFRPKGNLMESLATVVIEVWLMGLGCFGSSRQATSSLTGSISFVNKTTSGNGVHITIKRPSRKFDAINLNRLNWLERFDGTIWPELQYDDGQKRGKQKQIAPHNDCIQFTSPRLPKIQIQQPKSQTAISRSSKSIPRVLQKNGTKPTRRLHTRQEGPHWMTTRNTKKKWEQFRWSIVANENESRQFVVSRSATIHRYGDRRQATKSKKNARVFWFSVVIS